MLKVLVGILLSIIFFDSAYAQYVDCYSMRYDSANNKTERVSLGCIRQDRCEKQCEQIAKISCETPCGGHIGCAGCSLICSKNVIPCGNAGGNQDEDQKDNMMRNIVRLEPHAPSDDSVCVNLLGNDTRNFGYKNGSINTKFLWKEGPQCGYGGAWNDSVKDIIGTHGTTKYYWDEQNNIYKNVSLSGNRNVEIKKICVHPKNRTGDSKCFQIKAKIKNKN